MMATVRARRAAALLVGALVVAAGVSGCGGNSHSGTNVAVLNVTPQQVASVTFTAAGRSASFGRQGNAFTAQAGATPEFASELGLASDRLFPLDAYRALPGANASDPMYALDPSTAQPGRRAATCGPECSMTVTTRSGTSWRLTVGGRSFNDAGFYAAVAGRPTVYLLIAQSVSDIITFATSKPYEFPPTARVQKVDKAIDALSGDKPDTPDATAAPDPFLRQALAAKADRRAAAAGKPADNLVRAATSTEGQAGAPPPRSSGE
jgi:hypothetical protein